MMQTAGQVVVFPSEPPPWKGHAHNPDRELRQSNKSEKLKVVVVDDEAAIADTLVEILGDEGYEARSVSTGEEAIQLAGMFRPDVLISDVVIPGINGVEASIKIREMLPRCVIILFSGQAATVDLLKKAGEDGNEFEILAKPVKPEALLATIQRKIRFIP